MTKKLIILTLTLIFLGLSSDAAQTQRVKGYTKKNGTYVNSYQKTKADGKMYNNYSTKGNINPYTGKKGYKKQTSQYGYKY